MDYRRCSERNIRVQPEHRACDAGLDHDSFKEEQRRKADSHARVGRSPADKDGCCPCEEASRQSYEAPWTPDQQRDPLGRRLANGLGRCYPTRQARALTDSEICWHGLLAHKPASTEHTRHGV